MIGRKEWFTRRKYSGWGLTPRTWQGFAYIGSIVLFGFLLSEAPLPGALKMTISVIIIILVIADVLHIMATIKVDEREAKIEALAERNASWTMVGCLGILLIYFSMVDSSLYGRDFMPFIIFPMVTGMIVKAVSAYILQNKEL